MGGYPPPYRTDFDKFSAKNSIFCPKNIVFRPIFNNNKKIFLKTNGKKLAERGGTPPLTDDTRDSGFWILPLQGSVFWTIVKYDIEIQAYL